MASVVDRVEPDLQPSHFTDFFCRFDSWNVPLSMIRKRILFLNFLQNRLSKILWIFILASPSRIISVSQLDFYTPIVLSLYLLVFTLVRLSRLVWWIAIRSVWLASNDASPTLTIHKLIFPHQLHVLKRYDCWRLSYLPYIQLLGTRCPANRYRCCSAYHIHPDSHHHRPTIR